MLRSLDIILCCLNRAPCRDFASSWSAMPSSPPSPVILSPPSLFTDGKALPNVSFTSSSQMHPAEGGGGLVPTAQTHTWGLGEAVPERAQGNPSSRDMNACVHGPVSQLLVVCRPSSLCLGFKKHHPVSGSIFHVAFSLHATEEPEEEQINTLQLPGTPDCRTLPSLCPDVHTVHSSINFRPRSPPATSACCQQGPSRVASGYPCGPSAIPEGDSVMTERRWECPWLENQQPTPD
ncbi:uncharacterized protein [Vicugna pacos]|uniref:Uncharacterized protein n=1 Tax=Vicugna pacos TaxID=30538 RepID=A0ABM5C6M0_VICPA